MKKIIATLLLLPVILVVLLALAIAVAMQQDMVSRADLKFLVELGERGGLGAVLATIRAELYGVDPAAVADPSYGREQAAAAVGYLLSVDVQEANLNTPRDDAGRPYVATLDYDVLPRLTTLHPSFKLENLAPQGVEPKVGGMAFRADGKLVIASWDQDGAVFLVDPNAPVEQRVRRIAEGLHEPLGLTMVDDRLFVLQTQELTELIDTDDAVIDRYRAASYDWPSSSNFHSFAFGLLHREDDFYFLLSICVLPGGAIYLGELGNPPNWGEYGKPWFGLERMTWLGNEAFEMLAVKAQDDGFLIELTQPLATGLELSPADVLVKQWFYYPNEQYGGPKYDETVLPVSNVELAADRRSVRLRVPGLKAGYVVYLRLADRLRSATDNTLWTAEAWYTLNTIPGGATWVPLAQTSGDGWRDLFDGRTLAGWRNYGGDENDIRKWTVQDGTLALVQEGPFPLWDLIKSVIFGGPSGDLVYYREKFRDFELSLQWRISQGGNSGIFYLVKDETENVAWRTGIEMQVLDNEGHADGQIKTHRAGDLYDLIAANPETVRPPGEWNDVLIRVQDNQIEHWLNGVKVVSVLRGSNEWDALVAASKFADMPGYGKSATGYIALQDHGDPVWYRNIRVREL